MQMNFKLYIDRQRDLEEKKESSSFPDIIVCTEDFWYCCLQQQKGWFIKQQAFYKGYYGND